MFGFVPHHARLCMLSIKIFLSLLVVSIGFRKVIPKDVYYRVPTKFRFHVCVSEAMPLLFHSFCAVKNYKKRIVISNEVNHISKIRFFGIREFLAK